MSSQQEQAVVQAASDVYVPSCSPRLLPSETEGYTSAAFDYILIASFGRCNACVQILANSACCLKQLFWPMTAF